MFLKISTWVKAGDFISNERILFADLSFFDIFSFNLLTSSAILPLSFLVVDQHFIDETFNGMYKEERRVGKAFGVFSLIAISIACLGLLSLSAFITR